MKKLFLLCILAGSCLFGQQAKAQSFLNDLLNSLSNASSTSQSGSNALGSVLNGVVSSASQSASKSNNSTANLIGNLISSVTGSVTTTQANLVGTWTYSAPAVQFESKNMLTQAGGSAVATKVETKLTSIYKMVGIKAGSITFTFDNANNVTYKLSSRSYKGTYTFDSKAKTVTIKTATGQSIKAYVTISGNNMSLCFDSTKVLSLFTALSKSYNTSISSLAGNYDGMKTGFKFTKN